MLVDGVGVVLLEVIDLLLGGLRVALLPVVEGEGEAGEGADVDAVGEVGGGVVGKNGLKLFFFLGAVELLGVAEEGAAGAVGVRIFLLEGVDDFLGFGGAPILGGLVVEFFDG